MATDSPERAQQVEQALQALHPAGFASALQAGKDTWLFTNGNGEQILVPFSRDWAKEPPLAADEIPPEIACLLGPDDKTLMLMMPKEGFRNHQPPRYIDLDNAASESGDEARYSDAEPTR